MFHPADANHDWQMIIDELTACAAAWKRGDHDDIDYVTNASLVWLLGECYECNPILEPPSRWRPCLDETTAQKATEAFMPSQDEPLGSGLRELPLIYQACVPVVVRLSCRPGCQRAGVGSGRHAPGRLDNRPDQRR